MGSIGSVGWVYLLRGRGVAEMARTKAQPDPHDTWHGLGIIALCALGDHSVSLGEDMASLWMLTRLNTKSMV